MMTEIAKQSSQIETFGLQVWAGRHSPDHSRPHRHNEIELNYVQCGAVIYLYAGDERRIGAGESAVFWGAAPHQLVQYEPGTVIDIATVPLEDVLQWDLPQPFLARLLAGEMVRVSRDQPLPYDAALYRQWRHDLDAGTPHVALLEIKALLHRCALWHSHDPSVSQLRREERSAEAAPHKAHQMARYISQHFQQPLRVADVADVVGLHPHYAMTVFKAVFEMTIVEYLVQQRIAYAQQQLLVTDASVIDIAYDSGFQTISHFYSAFKRWCGTPPARYRAALRRHV